MGTTMKYFIRLLIILVLFSPASGSLAEEPPLALVRIQENSKQPVWRGEKYSFYVQLLSLTWFTGSPRFELPDAQEGILYKIQESPVQGSLNIQDQTYTYQLHEFWFFPQASGSVTLDEITVHFSTSAPPGQPALLHSLKTGPFTFDVRQVPGVSNSETLAAAPRLDVQQTWQPSSSEAVAGDAFKRTIVMKADNLAGIFLPEIAVGNIEGISIYPEAPEVSDRTERGEATGIRKETFTYLFEKEGDYEIEDISLRWWNTEKEQIETIELPGIQVSVSPNPNYQQQAAAPPAGRGISIQLSAALLLGALACLSLLKRFMPPALKRLQRLQAKYSQSETAFFRKLAASCKSNQAADTYNRLYWWIRKRDPQGSRSTSSLVRRSGSQALEQEAAALDETLFRAEKKAHSWQGRKMLQELSKLRKKFPSAPTQHAGKSPRYPLND